MMMKTLFEILDESNEDSKRLRENMTVDNAKILEHSNDIAIFELNKIIDEMKTLQLSLKKNWFEMTKAGIKTEDYREITPYWFKRLVFDYKKVFKYCTGYDWDDWDDDAYRLEGIDHITKSKQSMFGCKPFTSNKMTLGYPKSTDTERILNLEHKGIEIRTGNPEWGAEEGRMYFVIKHGNTIK